VSLRWGKVEGVWTIPPGPDSLKFIRAVEFLPDPGYHLVHEDFERSKFLVAGSLLAAFRLCAFEIWMSGRSGKTGRLFH
jgi:hypothetical protein